MRISSMILQRLSRVCECLLFLAFFLVTPVSATVPINPIPEKISEAAKSRIQATFLKAPLSFETNQGQTDEQVKFIARGSGYTMFLTATESVMVLSEASGSRQQAAGNSQKSDGEEEAAQSRIANRTAKIFGAAHEACRCQPRCRSIGARTTPWQGQLLYWELL
ncbi:MAG: hypothetical protein EXR70_21625 [Deltaproteobacteria bacterium]|nr:hypothetical protein [Deltaproteobacteria bacterium]